MGDMDKRPPIGPNERISATVTLDVDPGTGEVALRVRCEEGSHVAIGPGGVLLAFVSELRDDRQPHPTETPMRREEDMVGTRPKSYPLPSRTRREKRPNPNAFGRSVQEEELEIMRAEKPELGELRDCTILVDGEELEDMRRMTEEEARVVGEYLSETGVGTVEVVRSVEVFDG